MMDATDNHAAFADEWVHISVSLPWGNMGTGDADRIFGLLKELGFVETDWCVLERQDFARADYGPMEPRTANEFSDPEFWATRS